MDTPFSTVSPRRLSVFLCHASNNKPIVRDLYRKLKDYNVEPWLDEEELIGGQDWDLEIQKAVRKCDVVLVCLSPEFLVKEGYGQKEIKLALDTALEKPEGANYLIPLRLEECQLPERLRPFQAINYFEANGFDRLLKALKKRIEDKRDLLHIELAAIKKLTDAESMKAPATEVTPWYSNFATIDYLNVPRILIELLLEGVQLRGNYEFLYEIDTLRNQRVGYIYHLFESILHQWRPATLDLATLSGISREYIGAKIKFERDFRTKNVPWPEDAETYKFKSDLNKDPHLYCNMLEHKFYFPLDPRWITTNTAFRHLAPKGGHKRLSGLGILRQVDERTAIVTPLVIGVPKVNLSEIVLKDYLRGQRRQKRKDNGDGKEELNPDTEIDAEVAKDYFKNAFDL